MPKIDTSTIQGFDTMSDSEKLKALMEFEIPGEKDLSGMIEKSKFDKLASELAALKKAAKEKLPENEQAAQEQKEQFEQLQSQYNVLLKENTISKHTASYLSMGYSEKDAKEAATALYEGKMDKLFEVQKRASASFAEKIKADMIKNNPSPDGAGGGNGEEKTAAIKYAEYIGKMNADANKAADDIMKMY